MTNSDRIVAAAKEILAAHPEGLRHSELAPAIQDKLKDIPKNSIWTLTSSLNRLTPDILKVARGFFRLRSVTEEEAAALPIVEAEPPREANFYEPFADWLVNEIEECTIAIPLGGNKFKDKWGTPDVIGLREPARSSIIRPPTEIVAAEIKLDPTPLIVAFGQACSYRVFAHKSYIVVPSSSSEDDIARIDALSRIIGIGLILFDAASPENPKWDIRARALKGEPDMFYIDKYIRLIEEQLFSVGS